MLPDAISSPTLLCLDTFLRQNNWKSLQHHLNGGIFGNIRAKHAVMAWNEHNQRRDRPFDLACQHNKMKQSHSNSSFSIDNNCTFCEKLKFYPKKEFCATWQHLCAPPWLPHALHRQTPLVGFSQTKHCFGPESNGIRVRERTLAARDSSSPVRIRLRIPGLSKDKARL